MVSGDYGDEGLGAWESSTSSHGGFESALCIRSEALRWIFSARSDTHISTNCLQEVESLRQMCGRIIPRTFANFF